MLSKHLEATYVLCLCINNEAMHDYSHLKNVDNDLFKVHWKLSSAAYYTMEAIYWVIKIGERNAILYDMLQKLFMKRAAGIQFEKVKTVTISILCFSCRRGRSIKLLFFVFLTDLLLCLESFRNTSFGFCKLLVSFYSYVTFYCQYLELCIPKVQRIPLKS